MNMLEGKLIMENGTLVARGPDVSVPVDVSRFGETLVPGRDVIIGLRPHDLDRHEEGMPRVCEIVVEVVESLGFETYVHGWSRQAGPPIVVRRGGSVGGKSGE